MPATRRQRDFFAELLNDRKFPEGQDPEKLSEQFNNLSQDAASKWIDNALKLPKRDSGEGDDAPPPF